MAINFNELIRQLGTWKFWKEFLIMTAGMTVGAAAVYYFLVPSKLIIGSISGLSIVFSTLLAGIGINLKVSTMVLIMNAILLVLAWLLIGPEFGAKTVYTALILGPLMDLLAWIKPAEELLAPGQTSVMGDPWLDLLCFVLMLSISQAILFNINASTGGLDILAKIVNKYLHFDIGSSVTVAGVAICCTAFAINPFRLVVLGIIGTWINGLVVDFYTASLNRKKRVCIISDSHDEIRDYIINTLHRGCSLFPLKGGYSFDDKIEIQTLLTTDEYSALMNYLKKNQIDYFITAGNVSEVYGRWNSENKKRRPAKGKASQNSVSSGKSSAE